MSFKLRDFPILFNSEVINEWLSDYFNRITGTEITSVYKKNLGPWNMELTPSLVIDVPGVNTKTILGIKVMIFNDSDDKSYDSAQVTNGLSIEVNHTLKNITLTRSGGGFYDDVEFNDGVINRGVITIWT